MLNEWGNDMSTSGEIYSTNGGQDIYGTNLPQKF